jgi:hypothetical protein
MNTITIKTSKKTSGLSMLEMAGVLMVIAVLMAVLVSLGYDPFAYIHKAEIAGSVMSVDNTRKAATTYYEKYGRFAGLKGAEIDWKTRNYAYENWDMEVLRSEGFLEVGLSSKLATNSYVRLTPVNPYAVDPLVTENRGVLGSMAGNNGAYCITNIPKTMACGSNEVDFVLACIRSVEEKKGMNRDAAFALLTPRNLAARSDRSVLTAPALYACIMDGLNPLQACHWTPPPKPPPSATNPAPNTNYSYNPDDPPPVNPPSLTNAPTTPGETGYTNTTGALNNVTKGTAVVEAILQGVSLKDAQELSMLVDGRKQSRLSTSTDGFGRVKYNFGTSPKGTVFIYLTHK